MIRLLHHGIVLNLAAVLAAGPAIAQTPVIPAAAGHAPQEGPRPVARDLALRDGGLLIGQLVDESGAAMVQQPVTITLADGAVATVQTNADGAFAFRGVRGVAEVRATDAIAVVRAWSPGSAPPNASAALLLVRGDDVLRGQHYAGPATNGFFSRSKQLMANPLFVAGAIATAVAIPVAIANDDDPAS